MKNQGKLWLMQAEHHYYDALWVLQILEKCIYNSPTAHTSSKKS